MEVEVTLPDNRILTVSATLAELQDLYQATRRSKSTKRHYELLEAFGDQIAEKYPDVKPHLPPPPPSQNSHGSQTDSE